MWSQKTETKLKNKVSRDELDKFGQNVMHELKMWVDSQSDNHRNLDKFNAILQKDITLF
jgi:hypothetical protein